MITGLEIKIEARRLANNALFLSRYQHDQHSIEFGFHYGAKWMQEQVVPNWVNVTPETDLDKEHFYYVHLKDGRVSITMYSDWFFRDNVLRWAEIPLPPAP
jgi:hypothetical protein